MSVDPRKSRRFAAAFARPGARRAGLTAVTVAGGLLTLDLIGFVATIYYGPELLRAAEAAGVAELLRR